jgi:hypothetical protein
MKEASDDDAGAYDDNPAIAALRPYAGEQDQCDLAHGFERALDHPLNIYPTAELFQP